MSTAKPRGFRFPLVVIQHAVWLHARFALGLRDVEELLAERGVAVSYETVRAWFARFGPAIARGLRARRGGPNGRWHLDGMFATVGGRRMYLWRAVDGEGEVLDVLVQARRDKAAALRLMRRLLRRHSAAPEALVTDGLASCAAAAGELGLAGAHVGSRWANNRAEGSHVGVGAQITAGGCGGARTGSIGSVPRLDDRCPTRPMSRAGTGSPGRAIG